MNKTLALRTAVASIIVSNAGTVPVYYARLMDNTLRTYIIYTCDEVTRSDDRITYSVELNLVDYGTDTANIEELADVLQKAFDKHVHIDQYIGAHFYAEARNSVSEEDANILRRRLTFSAYLYERI